MFEFSKAYQTMDKDLIDYNNLTEKLTIVYDNPTDKFKYFLKNMKNKH